MMIESRILQWLQCFKLYLASIGLQQNFHLGGHRPQQGGPGPPMPPRGDAPGLAPLLLRLTYRTEQCNKTRFR